MFHHPRLEQLVEGDPVDLVRGGKVIEENLKQELISLAELKAAARRQGFESFQEIDEAILEPDGTVSFGRHEPTREAERYQEVLNRLDKLSSDLAALRG